MKIKIIKIFILFLIFLLGAFLLPKEQKPSFHKVLKVVEADKFYIDINNNNKIDNDELFTLEHISAFHPFKTKHSLYEAKRLDMTIEDYLKTGYLARDWAKYYLENKNVLVVKFGKDVYKDTKYRTIEFKVNSDDYTKTLLENGLGYINNDSNNIEDFNFQNLKQARINAQKLSEIKFYLLNLKTNVVHNLSCKYAKLSAQGELVGSKFQHFDLCKFCFNNMFKSNHIHNFADEEVFFKDFKNNSIYSKSQYKKFSNIELYLINPLENTAPDSNCKTDICKRIIHEINSAKESIDIAIYGINDEDEIITALKNAKQRGVKIRTITDYSPEGYKIYPDTITFNKEFSSKTDSASSIMHNKFFIFDNQKVLTGSTNISPSGVGGYNSNIAAIINSNEIANYYKNEFDKMYELNFSKKKKKNSNKALKLDDSEIEVYFSPEDDIFAELILKNIKNAKEEILISAFFLTDNNLIDELINLKQKGIKIAIILDASSALKFSARTNRLRRADIPTIVENWGGKNHEKTIEIDSKILIFGSCNFSKSGFYKNDENMIMIKNSEIAKFYRDYFLYLFNSIDKKYLYHFPKAESFESKNSCSDGIDNNFDGFIDTDDKNCSIK